MNDNIKIIKSLEDFGVLSDAVTETVKHETKKQKRGFLGALWATLDASIEQPVTSSVLRVESEKEVRRSGRGSMNKKL